MQHHLNVFVLLVTSVVFEKAMCEYCLCVPFWQCNEEDASIPEENIEDNEDNIDALDLRDSKPSKTCAGYFDVCCKVQCGMRGTDNLHQDTLRSRILGTNNEAKFGEFPWMLGILHQNTYKCGASLIHPKAALTAAHCVQSKAGTYKIRAGEYDWKSRKEPLEHQDRRVKKIVRHPQYEAQSLRNDIAVVFLDKAFQLSENVAIACLPPQDSFLYKTTNCVATGWGKNTYKTDVYQNVLKKVTLPIVARGKCVKALQKARLGPQFMLHRSFICAGGEANKDTCKGDGGSPLVCAIEGEKNRYEQVGIVSWGLKCGQYDTPGVYVNVARFTDWVDGQMKGHGLDHQVYKY